MVEVPDDLGLRLIRCAGKLDPGAINARHQADKAKRMELAEQRFAGWDAAAADLHRRRIREHMARIECGIDFETLWPKEWGPM